MKQVRSGLVNKYHVKSCHVLLFEGCARPIGEVKHRRLSMLFYGVHLAGCLVIGDKNGIIRQTLCGCLGSWGGYGVSGDACECCGYFDGVFVASGFVSFSGAFVAADS